MQVPEFHISEQVFFLINKGFGCFLTGYFSQLEGQLAGKTPVAPDIFIDQVFNAFFLQVQNDRTPSPESESPVLSGFYPVSLSEGHNKLFDVPAFPTEAGDRPQGMNFDLRNRLFPFYLFPLVGKKHLFGGQSKSAHKLVPGFNWGPPSAAYRLRKEDGI
jgi:hypothetical protein